MCASVSGNDPNPRLSAWIVAATLAMVAVPAAITLHTVRSPGTLQVLNSNPTPYGYTWSLLLFMVPIAVIAFWFLPAERVEIPRQTLWRTIVVLAPLGFGLDFFFARRFFVFRNVGATLGIGAPPLGAPVPIEEYIFYFTGLLCVLLIYVWLDEFWLAAYNAPDYPGESKKISRLFQFHPTSAVVGLVLIVMAVLYKKMLSPSPEGFPGYFTVLVIGAFIPAMSFFPTARPFINWRAFSLTLFIIVLGKFAVGATLPGPACRSRRSVFGLQSATRR